MQDALKNEKGIGIGRVLNIILTSLILKQTRLFYQAVHFISQVLEFIFFCLTAYCFADILFLLAHLLFKSLFIEDLSNSLPFSTTLNSKGLCQDSRDRRTISDSLRVELVESFLSLSTRPSGTVVLAVIIPQCIYFFMRSCIIAHICSHTRRFVRTFAQSLNRFEPNLEGDSLLA